jgi:ABC-2 type transport system permease protein
MPVFKLYFKLLYKALPALAIYMSIFVIVTVCIALSGTNNNSSVFEPSKVKIAFINHDKDSEIVKGLKNQLDKSCNFIELKDSNDSLKDALFFRTVEYIVIVPEGFTQKMLSGQDVSLEKLTVPGSSNSAYVDLTVNSYFSTAKIYLNSMPNITQEELIKRVNADLTSNVKVNMASSNGQKVDHSSMVNYYNYLVYGLVSILVMGVGLTMMSFTNLELRRRSVVSPIPLFKINLQQMLGNLIFTVVCVVILVAAGFILNKKSTYDINTVLFIINAVVMSIAALSMSFLVGISVKSREATNGLANILGLGLCFLSGVFVPREFLSDTTLNIAKFTPTYWYVAANEAIGKLTNFSWNNVSNIVYYMLIQLGFAAGLFAISLVVSKKKSTAEN